VIIRKQGFARIAILGNPSDGFYGKTISALIRNFAATVEVWESPEVSIIPDREHDATEFDSLEHLRATAAAQGYYGGLRLILATCKRFADVCREHGIALPARNFTVRYGTHIPRQVGLGGSSAIINAAFHALMEFYNIPVSAFPLPSLPNIIRQVETDELSIQAGLQDRVIAVYGGVVYMDFDRKLMESRGHGDYVRLDPSLLPPLFIAWGGPSGESGQAHSPIRVLWERGDERVREGMKRFAGLAEEGWKTLRDRDVKRLGDLMSANFDLRLELYGEAAVGEQSLRLVRLARERGCPAKLPGSGGAVIGIVPDSDDAWQALIRAYEAEGFSCARAEIDDQPSR
jgi:galactokinase/mevalonate kinase-like predicted kinase